MLSTTLHTHTNQKCVKIPGAISFQLHRYSVNFAIVAVAVLVLVATAVARLFVDLAAFSYE